MRVERSSIATTCASVEQPQTVPALRRSHAECDRVQLDASCRARTDADLAPAATCLDSSPADLRARMLDQHCLTGQSAGGAMHRRTYRTTLPTASRFCRTRARSRGVGRGCSAPTDPRDPDARRFRADQVARREPSRFAQPHTVTDRRAVICRASAAFICAICAVCGFHHASSVTAFERVQSATSALAS